MCSVCIADMLRSSPLSHYTVSIASLQCEVLSALLANRSTELRESGDRLSRLLAVIGQAAV